MLQNLKDIIYKVFDNNNSSNEVLTYLRFKLGQIKQAFDSWFSLFPLIVCFTNILYDALDLLLKPDHDWLKHDKHNKRHSLYLLQQTKFIACNSLFCFMFC